MSRQTVSAEQLLEILNRELATRDECAECTFTGELRRLTDPYPDGGNWDRSLVVRGRPRDPHQCGAAAADIISAIAAEYNLQ